MTHELAVQLITGAMILWAITTLAVLIFMGKDWFKENKKKRDEKRREVKRGNRFLPNEQFCKHCLTHDYFFQGEGSWSPERCPFHPKSDDVILWKNMTYLQQNEAAKKFKDMWFEKYGVEYFFIYKH